MIRATTTLALALATASCGAVSARVTADAPAPATVAVLPVAGTATAGLRDSARELLRSRLVAQGYRAPESTWVDGVLASRGWLRDPATYRLDAAEADATLAALGVDALLVADDLDESGFNLLAIRRHAISGAFALQGTGRRERWSAAHTASTFGGLAVGSGQVLTELRLLGVHGTPAETMALLDELLEDVVSTIPSREPGALPPPPPSPTGLATTSERRADGSRRVTVRANAMPGCALRFALSPHVDGVPMATEGQDGVFVGRIDLPADAAPKRVLVRARDMWGRETVAEATL